LMSAPKAALASAGVSLRICATAKPLKLMVSLASEIDRSPVMSFADELTARQYPLSCAPQQREQLKISIAAAPENSPLLILRG
jgi:hypothetical protein